MMFFLLFHLYKMYLSKWSYFRDYCGYSVDLSCRQKGSRPTWIECETYGRLYPIGFFKSTEKRPTHPTCLWCGCSNSKNGKRAHVENNHTVLGRFFFQRNRNNDRMCGFYWKKFTRLICTMGVGHSNIGCLHSGESETPVLAQCSNLGASGVPNWLWRPGWLPAASLLLSSC